MTQPLEHNPLVQQRSAQIAQLPGQLRWFGDPVLRGVATPFSPDEIERGEAKALADELASVLGYIRQQTGLGRAIAAPQIGVLRRMFVAYNPQTDGFDTYVNPVVASASQTQGIYREMCLSGIPLSGAVVRPWEIEIEYTDLAGSSLKQTLDPIRSRVSQHEIDHLDGILFIDRAEAKSLAFDFDWATLRERNSLRKLE
ncbi:MAG TPA: peptide deformylase [Phototrophicaceae bacterium]|nr:peptide deformylase [Phototrophicaceae bacterium]